MCKLRTPLLSHFSSRIKIHLKLFVTFPVEDIACEESQSVESTVNCSCHIVCHTTYTSSMMTDELMHGVCQRRFHKRINTKANATLICNI